MTVEVGQQIPDVTLVSADRKAVRLRELIDRPTVLAFFPGAFTSTCTREMCTFRDSLARFTGMRAQVIGISVDSPFAQKAFADQNGLTFPLLSDFTRQAVRAFGIEDPHFAGGLLPGVAKRSVFVVDRTGTVVYRWVSDNPAVEPDYDEVAEAVRRAA
ncbi:MAG: redoxin domain-containing protein [Armatimonadota bacterium]|nr:redoxin domain-containing protein [Armatimonadota bacterium]MDR7401622.1 redoxin domain-containing protein [Armatimonadota bacterium]MDR7404310.1 redoxin domain-containing protein [Armatimonadota bacterium]MDR7436887.1 redoxin domain-containing protein [Armatimonadota bacterium]MDR7471572.1 redoxin domain-containing protein [Armatimonadota bacterium]